MSPVWIEPFDKIEEEAPRLYPAENLLAAVLSIVLPGSGHLVKAGGSDIPHRWRTIGVVWTIFSLAFYGALILFRVAAGSRLYLVTAIAALLLSSAAVYDCCLRGTPHSATRKLGFFALAVLASIIWVNAVCYWCALGAGFRYFLNPSKAMTPTINDGDRFLVDWNYYRDHKPQDGDIVVIFQQVQRIHRVNRVCGVGGDTVQISDGKLIRNGAAVEENYIGGDPPRPGVADWLTAVPPRTIPAGKLFLMGDNRNNSYDSRAPEVGDFPESDLRGKVVRVANWF